MTTVAELQALPVRGARERGSEAWRLQGILAFFFSQTRFSPSIHQGVSAPPPETRGFGLQQTMLRIKDPELSLRFYTGVLGMTLLTRLDFPERDFSLYFLGFTSSSDTAAIPDDPADRAEWVFNLPNTLELTHNYGTEAEAGRVYSSGNDDGSKGFGHIGVSVPSVAAACARFEFLGVPFVKRPDAGSMKDIAFIADPDGYWIEIIEPGKMRQFASS